MFCCLMFKYLLLRRVPSEEKRNEKTVTVEQSRNHQSNDCPTELLISSSANPVNRISPNLQWQCHLLAQQYSIINWRVGKPIKYQWTTNIRFEFYWKRTNMVYRCYYYCDWGRKIYLPTISNSKLYLISYFRSIVNTIGTPKIMLTL